ncbi:MAG: two-component regulator propeller domain-containing protein [Ferruginibacter sp.]
MRRVLPYLLTTVITLSYICPVEAQIAGDSYFQLEKDKKQIQINTLFKDNIGYLYAGTDNGLYKFDGEKYTRIDFTNTEFNDTVTAIYQDRKGLLWVGFNSGRIANVENNKLLYINPEEGTPQRKITAFLQDKEDNLWFSTQGEGIYCLKKNILYVIDVEDGLSDGSVNSMAITDNGYIIAGTDQGLNICSFKNGQKKISIIGPADGLPDYIVTAMVSAGNNMFWIGLQENGFCLFDFNSKKVLVPEVSKHWEHGQINSMLLAQNILWVATQGNGFYKYVLNGNVLEKAPDNIFDKTINSMIEDMQGNIWLSAHPYGLIRTHGESLKLTPIPSSPPFEHIHVVLGDKDGSTWISNKENELIKLTTKNNITKERKLKLAGVSEKTDITSLYQDVNGNIWVGLIGKGIYIVDPFTFKYRIFKENSLFINSTILSITGNKNNVYVSSLVGLMVIEITAENTDINTLCRFTNYDNVSTGTNYIYNIFKDSKDRIWFATDGNGLTMLKGNHFTYYNDREKIKDNRIYSVAEDRNGNIWFSTASAGIYKFDGKTFTNYGVNEGLSDLKLSVLKIDPSGNIIIVHKKGLDILDPVTGDISYVGGSQGISNINVEDLGAISTDTSGNIMVSTEKGILTYSFPEHSLQKPTALIESIQLFLTDLGNRTSNIFEHDENNFTFSYTGLYYSDPEKVYYRYTLEGFDNNWIYTTDRSKNFPKLGPGVYKFRIQASLNKNFSNASEDSYSFTIKQAVYKTWWFLLGCAVILISLIYLYVKHRERELKRFQTLKQEKIHFQFEMLRSQINPHFLFNSFNTLISTIEDEPHLAAEYAEQLSDFFRNIVNQRDKDAISLAEEIETLNSYAFLQKKRYGDSLRVEINISEEEKKKYKIPPLSLQLLMENAIKHNALSEVNPLIINISIADDAYLCIKNNINHKNKKQTGAGMGLQNIVTRYDLLTNKPVRILHDDHLFTVLLPLLK